MGIQQQVEKKPSGSMIRGGVKPARWLHSNTHLIGDSEKQNWSSSATDFAQKLAATTASFLVLGARTRSMLPTFYGPNTACIRLPLRGHLIYTQNGAGETSSDGLGPDSIIIY